MEWLNSQIDEVDLSWLSPDHQAMHHVISGGRSETVSEHTELVFDLARAGLSAEVSIALNDSLAKCIFDVNSVRELPEDLVEHSSFVMDAVGKGDYKTAIFYAAQIRKIAIEVALSLAGLEEFSTQLETDMRCHTTNRFVVSSTAQTKSKNGNSLKLSLIHI